MLPVIILFLIGCIVGIWLVITAIIIRKHLTEWGMMLMIFIGIFIAIACGVMALTLGYVYVQLI